MHEYINHAGKEILKSGAYVAINGDRSSSNCSKGFANWTRNKDNIVTRLNIRVRYHSRVLSFHPTKQIPMLVFLYHN